jgi:hypothetical protein
MAKQQTHIHKYLRVLLSERTGEKVFRCQLPGCRHHLPRGLAVGQLSVCWNCLNKFPLTMENTKLTRPICDLCRDLRAEDRGFRKGQIQTRQEDKILDSLMKDLGL